MSLSAPQFYLCILHLSAPLCWWGIRTVALTTVTVFKSVYVSVVGCPAVVQLP